MASVAGTVDLHRLAEERSIAYHRAIAERIARDPSVLERARERVRAWVTGQGPVPEFARAWDEVLARPLPELLRFLTDEGERARELRQSTPFAGALPPRVRWEIWRAVRESRARTG
jgi:hypothetical protein